MSVNNQTTPAYVIPGERDWRPTEEAWKGPLGHPYGMTAYTRVMPDGEVRIYPSMEAAYA